MNPETQIVVIGGGGAGLAAAVAAAEKGADVILLEKTAKTGGNTAMAGGFFAAESPVQKRLGIDAPRDLFFKVAMDFAHWKINPRIIRAFIDKSGDTVRWLEDKGISFNIQGEERYRLKQRIPPTWHCPQGYGAGSIEVLTREAERLGVRIFYRVAAEDLITNENNEVIGVLARTSDGDTIEIKAGTTIIATGGYGGNKELLKKYCPYYEENMQLFGFPNMGDGILMAIRAGAGTEGLGLIHQETWGVPGEPKEIMRTAVQPNTIWVNKRGVRYVDEAAPTPHESVNGVDQQPDKVSYSIFDESIKQDIANSGKLIDHNFLPPLYPSSEGKNLDELLKLASDRGNAKISNSLDDIAVWIGAKPETLKATVAEYNSFCDSKHDAIFVKDPVHLVSLHTPPYYAIRCVIRFLGTIGGIKINEKMEVINRENNPIPGLYAAGIDTGGWQAETYNQLLAGTTYGFALGSGRIAAENSVEYLKTHHA